MVVLLSKISLEALIKVMNCGRGLWSSNGVLEGYLIPSQVSLETLIKVKSLKIVVSTGAYNGFSPRC